mgnify:CR=1 FL=1
MPTIPLIQLAKSRSSEEFESSCCIPYSRNPINSKRYKEIIECFAEYGRNRKKQRMKMYVYMSK